MDLSNSHHKAKSKINYLQVTSPEKSRTVVSSQRKQVLPTYIGFTSQLNLPYTCNENITFDQFYFNLVSNTSVAPLSGVCMFFKHFS